MMIAIGTTAKDHFPLCCAIEVNVGMLKFGLDILLRCPVPRRPSVEMGFGLIDSFPVPSL
jgi:hypothetical protein